MADQNRKRSSEKEPREQEGSQAESTESQRERSNIEPASTADDRGVSDELDSETELDELDGDSIVEDEEDISGSSR